MSRDLKLLDRHLHHWRDQGLIAEDLAAKLRGASIELTQRSTRRVVRTALAVLGGGLLLSGLILIVAENWEALHRVFKLGSWAVLQVAFLVAAQRLGRRWPDRPALAEVMAFVAGGWMLGGIALVSQIYQLDSRPPNGIWLWLVLVLPAAWLLERRAVAAVLFIALVAALGLEAAEADSLIYVRDGAGPWAWLAIPLLAAVVVSWLPRPASVIAGWTGLWTFVAANFFLLVFGASKELDRSDLGRGWWLAGAGILVGLLLPQRCLPRTWDALTARLVLGATFLPWILMGSRYDGSLAKDHVALGLAWVVQFVLAVLAIRAGARHGADGWVNLGYLALLVGILTRYFDFFGDYLQGGTALALTGALLLFILYALERARRRTLIREAQA